MDNNGSNMISEEYLDDMFLNNEVPTDVERMLYRDNMNLKSPGDVFLWFKTLPFRSQKIMLSSMISVMGDENNTKMRGIIPFPAFGGTPELSRSETNYNGKRMKPMTKDIDDNFPSLERPLPRLGASSPPLLKTVVQEDDTFSNLPHENVTVRKKK
jgi:hypothetical protein